MANVVIAAVRPTRITLDAGMEDYISVWVQPTTPAVAPAKPPIIVSQYAALF